MIRITGIVTDVIKHSDRHNVLTLFTRERGRMSFVTHGGGGKKGASRMAMMMPLSVVTADIQLDATRELQLLTGISRAEIWHDIYFNPVKSAIAIFMAEFLNAYLRFSEADPMLWDYTAVAIRHLDKSRKGTANRHIAFLTGMLPYAGISPDLSGFPFTRGKEIWFDMREGSLTDAPPLHRDTIRPQFSEYLSRIVRMNAANCHLFKFNAGQRRQILDNLIRYYAIHFPGMCTLKSPEVLKELFE